MNPIDNRDSKDATSKNPINSWNSKSAHSNVQTHLSCKVTAKVV